MSDKPAQQSDTKSENKTSAENWMDKKGRVPDAVKDEVLALREEKKQREIRKLKKTRKGIKQQDRMELFLREFLNNGGNATQAALKVFNCSTVESASVMGSRYLKKARDTARLYMEKQGYSYGKMMDIAMEKMEDSKKPDWWDRLMKMAGYEDFLGGSKKNAPVSVNVFQAHKNFASEYVVDGEIEEADELDEKASLEEGKPAQDEN